MNKVRKPDNVVDNPASMPYPTNVGAPAFTVPDVLTKNRERGANARHQLTTKFEEIKKQYFALAQLAEDTEMVYNSKYAFNPIVGKIYHLYRGYDGELFLSLIEPERWGMEFHGSFKLTSEHTWERQ